MLLWKYLKFCQGTGCEIPQNRRLTNDRTQQRREITLGVHCGQVEHQGLFLCSGVPPVAISHENLLQIVTAPPVPGIGGQCPLTMRTVAFYCSLLPCPARYRWAVPTDNTHGSFLLFVTSLTRPVSLLRCSRCLGQSPLWQGSFFTFPVDFFPGIGYTGVNQLNACLIV